jgi:meso-butanediol dehydrogenase/(S,S)-butanediol dehydrogenase/diacetyl reductase
MQLKDKVAIITGAGAGIGRAIAARYAREGARVVLAEIDPDTGKAAEKAIRESGGEALFVRTDVACEDQVHALVEATIARLGRADILVNNAGILLSQKEGRAHELSNEAWDRTMTVNLRGPWWCSKYVIPSMLQQGGGCIIFIASRTGLQGFTRLTAYSAAKGGIFSLMRAMAVDYAPDNIRVNAIVPGTTDTPMNAALLSDPDVRQKYIAKIPAGRLGVAEDIAGMAVFLASDDAEYCLGGVYMVDGGATLT